jgi:hypothetical protein
MSNFIKKVLNTLYPAQFKEAGVKAVQDAVHNVGHWMSTHVGLNALGMLAGRRVAISPVAALLGKAATNLATDFIARADSLPAGTAPHAIVHATLKEFSTNKAFTVAPHAEEMHVAAKAIEDLIQEFKKATEDKAVDPRLKYHMGAAYLTGSPRVTFTDPAPIGTVGSFLFNLKGSSSLTSSPLISKEDPATCTRVKTYEGQFRFDESWEAFCAGMRGIRGKMSKKAQEAMASITTGGLISLDAYKKLNEFSPDSASVAEKIHKETLEIMESVPEDGDETFEDEPGPSFGRKRKRT